MDSGARRLVLVDVTDKSDNEIIAYAFLRRYLPQIQL